LAPCSDADWDQQRQSEVADQPAQPDAHALLRAVAGGELDDPVDPAAT